MFGNLSYVALADAYLWAVAAALIAPGAGEVASSVSEVSLEVAAVAKRVMPFLACRD